ncbi:MAG: hypothetical protein GYB66_15815 [Chloroflexi bacterium]|nr:hypothetical protein [Chloroflexota bacterium]
MPEHNQNALRATIGLVLVLLLAGLACNLTREDDNTTQIGGNGSPPEVTILNPPANAVVGEELLLEVEATDPTGQGVTRVEMRVNNRPVDQKSSPEPGGVSPLRVNLTWVPARSGNVTIQVFAWRGSVASEPATLELTIGSAALATATSAAAPGTDGELAPPTLGPCRARVDANALNFRSAPDTSSDDYIIGRFQLNDEPLIRGQLPDGSWYYVQAPSGQLGWVSTAYVTALGSCGTIPIQQPPATPTPQPTNTLAPSAIPAPADLVALPISGRVSVQINEGGPTTENYSLQVQNAGGQDSGQFQVQIVLPGGEEVIRTIDNLPPGAVISVGEGGGPQPVTFTSPGTQQLSMHVDFNNNIEESNEGNNIALLDISVDAPPPPDAEDGPPVDQEP